MLNEKHGLTHLEIIQIENMQIIVVPAEGYGQANPYHTMSLIIQHNLHH
jgi:hypothetical protein